MANTTSPLSDVSQRYAASLFALAVEDDSLAQTETALNSFETLLEESEDLKRLVNSPVFSADDQLRAISALVDQSKTTTLVGNFLKVAAQNRRLFAVPGMISAFRELAAEHRGEMSADVACAHKLSDAQSTQLAAMLKEVAGKDVKMNVSVDPGLLGGMIVKLGSRQIDTSLKTKLNSLKLALKEVG